MMPKISIGQGVAQFHWLTPFPLTTVQEKTLFPSASFLPRRQPVTARE